MNFNLKLIFLLIFLSSCAATRVTTTEHTAVEQALLTYTSRKAFSSVDFSELKNRKVFIQEIVMPSRFPKSNFSNNSQWHEINPDFLKALLEKNLLRAGARLMEKKQDADLILRLVCDIAAIDDSEFVMGIPSVPVPLPTGGSSLQTPEISLFSSKRQVGKIRFSIYGRDRVSGSLAFTKKSKAARKYYSRWSLLLIFGWRVTDLGRPF